MVDVLVAVTETGVRTVVLMWSEEHEPCLATSPNGVPCIKPAHDSGEWHVGFVDGNLTMPKKWRDLWLS